MVSRRWGRGGEQRHLKIACYQRPPHPRIQVPDLADLDRRRGCRLELERGGGLLRPPWGDGRAGGRPAASGACARVGRWGSVASGGTSEQRRMESRRCSGLRFNERGARHRCGYMHGFNRRRCGGPRGSYCGAVSGLDRGGGELQAAADSEQWAGADGVMAGRLGAAEGADEGGAGLARSMRSLQRRPRGC